jgi:uncharacterized protein
MKKSQFIVEQVGFSDDTILLYSTYTTSLVELDKKIYEEVFINKNYTKNKEDVQALYDMGFLVSDDKDEVAFLEKLRIETLKANSSSPSYYIVCPTTGCNARCYYCFEKGIEQKRMDERTANAVAEYILKHHDSDHLVIQWFGGEPLLEASTISYITDYLHENGVSFDSKIITNGYLLSDEVVELAKNKWNVRIIQITIDDLFAEYNRIKDYTYHNVDAFEIIMENIQRCLHENINVRIRINFNPLECNKAIKTVDYLKNRFGNDSNFFVYLAPIDSKDIPAITSEFSQQEKHPLIALLDAEKNFCSFGNYDKRIENGTKYEAILRKYYLTPIPTSCYGGCESSLTIDSAGNIFNCHRLLGHEEYSSGNVFTGRETNEVAKIYANPIIEDDECNKCNLLPLCQGGCKYRGYMYGKEHACTTTKGAIKELVRRAAVEMNDV